MLVGYAVGGCLTPPSGGARPGQERCFLSLEAPVSRVCGYDSPFPLVHEKFYVPDERRCFEGIKALLEY